MGGTINLGTGHTIVASLAGAHTTSAPVYHAAWVDTDTDLPGSSWGVLNGTSEVTVVAAPSSGIRQVDFIRVYNADSALATALISVASGSDRRAVRRVVLDPLTAADALEGSPPSTTAGVYEPAITGGTTSQYWRGDKTWQTLPATHDPVTVSDTTSLDLSITGQQISGVVLPAGISHDTLADLTATKSHTQYSSTAHLHTGVYQEAGAAPTAHDITSHTSWPAGLTALELGYVDGVTSSIQTQLAGKSSTAHLHPTLVPYTGATGDVDIGTHKLIGTTQNFIDINRCGFTSRTETSISFDGANTFTLADAGAGWSYYRAGIKHTISGNKTVVLSATPPAATGMYYIYIDSGTGALIASLSAWTLADSIIPVATVAWNNALTPKHLLADERHTCLIDRATHLHEHSTEGTKSLGGGALSGLVASSDNAVSKRPTIASAQIADEDLRLTLATLTPDAVTLTSPDYLVAYRTASSTWEWRASDMPFVYNAVTSFIQWDNAGTLQDGNGGTGGNARWFNSYIMFNNTSGASRFLIFPGRGSFTSLALAQAENPLLFGFTGLPIGEGVVAWQLTWAINATYTGVGKCVYVAQKAIGIAFSGVASSGVGIDHGSLAGLQGGATGEYYHLAAAEHSTLLSTALIYEPKIAAGTTGQYWRGDKSWQTLPTSTAPTAHQLDGVAHTVSGLTTGHFLKASGSTAVVFAAHGLTYTDVGASASAHNHSGVYEPVLGNPSADGYALVSTTAGVRSWAAASGGGGDPFESASFWALMGG